MIITAYHGTEKIFDIFDYRFVGTASGVKSSYFFFTSEIENALTFGDIVLKCNLIIDRPYIVKDGLQGKSPRMWADEISIMNFENDTDYDGVILLNVIDSYGFVTSDIYVPFDLDNIEICGIL